MADEVVLDLQGTRITCAVRDVLHQNFEYSYCTYYKKDDESLLNTLCEKYGTDKGESKPDGHPYPWPSHTYADFIERHFAHCREYVRNVFECGLGTNNPDLPSTMGPNGKPGASLKMWREYFPNANIYGADIDQTILFQDERIRTFFVDQTKPDSIADLWKTLTVSGFDLMIDDGLHSYEAGICLLENSFDRLKKNGMYIIEDIPVKDMFLFRAYFSDHSYKADFVNLYRQRANMDNNRLIVIRK
jgi:hypothetical protein